MREASADGQVDIVATWVDGSALSFCSCGIGIVGSYGGAGRMISDEHVAVVRMCA